MIYKNSEIPSTYNKIAEISDNYIVWVEETALSSKTKYNAYIQYFSPSFYYYFTDDYMISYGHDYVLNANYYNEGTSFLIDNYDVDFILYTQSIDSDYISLADSARSDSITIFIGQILCVIAMLWVFKQLSRLFFKGGLS